MPSFPKHEYVRSKALMEAYRAIPCQHCGRFDGTVCGAHSNTQRDGKGKGIKGDDNKAASLCWVCHIDLDQGSRLSREERETMHENARRKTVAELLRRGLWPMGVAIPDIRVFN
jgi:hypothetical protein